MNNDANPLTAIAQSGEQTQIKDFDIAGSDIKVNEATQTYDLEPSEKNREMLEYARLDGVARRMLLRPDLYSDAEFDATFKELHTRRFLDDPRLMTAFDRPGDEHAGQGRLSDFIEFTDSLSKMSTAKKQMEAIGTKYSASLPEYDAWMKAQQEADGGAAFARKYLDENGRKWGDKARSVLGMLNINKWLDHATRPEAQKDENLAPQWLSDWDAKKEVENRFTNEKLLMGAAQMMPFLTKEQRNLVNLVAHGADPAEFSGILRAMKKEDRNLMRSMIQAVRPEYKDLAWIPDEGLVRAASSVSQSARSFGRAAQMLGYRALHTGYMSGSWYNPFSWRIHGLAPGAKEEMDKMRDDFLEDIRDYEALSKTKFSDPEGFVSKATAGFFDSSPIQFSMIGGELAKRGGTAMVESGQKWGYALQGAGYLMQGYTAASMIGEHFDNMLLNGIDPDKAVALSFTGGLAATWIERWNLNSYLGLNLSPAEMKRIGVRAAFRAGLKMDGKELAKVARTNAKQALVITSTELGEEVSQALEQEGMVEVGRGKDLVSAFTGDTATQKAFDALVEALPTCSAFGFMGTLDSTGSTRNAALATYKDNLDTVSRAIAEREGKDALDLEVRSASAAHARNMADRVAVATAGMSNKERAAWLNAQEDMTDAERAFYAEHCALKEAISAQEGSSYANAILSGSINEALFEKEGWKFEHDESGKIIGITSKDGDTIPINIQDRKVTIEELDDQSVAMFIEEWNEMYPDKSFNANALTDENERKHLESAISEYINGSFNPNSGITLYLGNDATRDNAEHTLAHEIIHKLLDDIEKSTTREARKTVRSLKLALGNFYNEQSAIEGEVAAQGIAAANRENAAPDTIDWSAVAHNVGEAFKRIGTLGIKRGEWKDTFKSTNALGIDPKAILGRIIGSAILTAKEQRENEEAWRKERKEVIAQILAERDAKATKKKAMRKAEAERRTQEAAERSERLKAEAEAERKEAQSQAIAKAQEEERKRKDYERNRKDSPFPRLVPAPHIVKANTPAAAESSQRGFRAYETLWKVANGKKLSKSDIAFLGEEYGLPAEVLTKPDKFSAESLGKFNDALSRLWADVKSVRIAVPPVYVATEADKLRVLPNEVYDPVFDRFVDGEIIVDPSKALPFADESAAGTRFSIANAQTQREYDDVVSRFTNADGTKKRGWMKAPNGKPTKLTERQWVQVRTPSFKKWFGDWEASAEIPSATLREAKANLDSLIKAGEIVTTADEIPLKFSGQAKKAWSKDAEKESDNSAAHWAAVGNIENLCIRAKVLWEESPRNGSSDIRAYVKHGAVFTFEGVPYLAKITTKAYPGHEKQNFYNVESISVEKINAHGIHKTIAKGQSLDVSDEDKISQLVDSVKSASKVVDENGEPLVVYRGAPYDPLAQEPGKGVIAPERYFSPNEKYARRYEKGNGATRAYFLNLRKPFDIRNEVDAQRMLELKGGHEFATGASGALDWAEAPDAEELNERWNGEYDGLVLDEGGDPSENGVIHRGISFVPLQGGAQVKSATDNTGAFDGTNADIRFSIGGIFTGSAADYEKPSLHYVGTGEGSQVYGWGLYGSTVRGVAESYAKKGTYSQDPVHPTLDGKTEDEWAEKSPERLALQWLFRYGDLETVKSEVIDSWENPTPDVQAAFDLLLNESNRFATDEKKQHLYEQTFFTDRAPGDESHLLKWYEPVSEDMQNRLLESAVKEGKASKSGKYFFIGENTMLESGTRQTGEELYLMFRDMLGSQKAASEWLAAHGIDGVKYPVDSYGSKGVKDGDTAGWNYVSFRDDNIRVDHKCSDGEQRFSIATLGKYRTDDLRSLAHRVKDGDAEAIAEAGRRLAVILPPDVVLVPMPSHTGEPTTMRLLADAIAANANGAKVVDALRSNAHESNYAQKKRGEEPAEIEMRKVADIPENADVYIVDNVIDTGATYTAAIEAIPNAHILALADTDRTPREKLSMTRSIAEIDAQDGTNLQGIGKLVAEVKERGEKPRGRQGHFNLSKTPEFLKNILSGEYFTVKAGVILDHFGKDPDHSLTIEDWAKISEALHDPLVIAKYSFVNKAGKRYYAPKSYRIWVEAVINGHWAIVGVEVKSPSRNIDVNAVETVYGDERISLNPEDIVYSRNNEEGIRTLLGGPNSHEYSESPSTPQIVPYSPAERNTQRFSIGRPDSRRALKYYLAREIVENDNLPSTRGIVNTARRLGVDRYEIPQIIAEAQASAAEDIKMLRYIASDPKIEKLVVSAGLTAYYEKAIKRARQTAVKYSRDVSELKEKSSKALERTVRTVRGEEYDEMLRRDGIDINAILLAIRPDEREQPTQTSSSETGNAAAGNATPTPQSEAEGRAAAQSAIARAKELVEAAKAAAATAPDTSTTGNKAQNATPSGDKGDTAASDGEGATDADPMAGAISKAYYRAIAESGITLDNPAAVVQLIKAQTERYILDNPAKVSDLDRDNVFASPIARAIFAGNVASFAQAVAAAYAPSYARIRIGKKAQLLNDHTVNSSAAIERVASEIFEDLHRDIIRQSRNSLISDIKKLLKKGANGYSERAERQDRKISADAQSWCKAALWAINVAPSKVEEESAKLQPTLLSYGSSKSEAENSRYRDFADAELKLNLLTSFGKIRERMPAELAELRDKVGQMVDEGIFDAMTFSEKWEATRNAVIEDALPAIVGNPKDEGREPEKTSWLYSLVGMMKPKWRQLTRFCRDDEVRKRSLKAMGTVETMIQTAYDKEANYRTEQRNRLKDLLISVYGSESNARKALNADIDEKLWAELDRGEQHNEWTVGRVLQMYVSCVQSDYADNCEKYNRGADYVAKLEELINALDPRHFDLIRGLREFYLAQGDDLSEVYIRTAGVPLWTPNRNYMPVAIDNPHNRAKDAEVRTYNPYATSLTPRIKHGLDFDQKADIIETCFERIDDAAHTIGWADTGSLVIGICQSDRILNAIRKAHGRAVMGQWNRYILDVVAPKAELNTKEAQFAKAMMRFASRLFLGLNPKSWAKQLASVPCYALSACGKISDVAASLSFWALHPAEGIKVARDLSETRAFQARYGLALSQELKYATSSDGALKTWWQATMDKAMSGVYVFDKLGTYLLAGIYRRRRMALEQDGMPAAEASEVAAAWLMHIVDKTAQSGRTVNTTELQRAGGAWAFLLQFKSSSAQQTQFEIVAIQEALANPTDAKRWKKAAAVIAINHFIVPAIMTSIDALMLMLTGWGIPDEEKRRRLSAIFAANVLSGSLGSIAFLGTVIEGVARGAMDWAIAGKKPSARTVGNQPVPMFSVVEHFWNSGNKAMKAFEELQYGDIENGVIDMVEAIGGVIPGISSPVRTATKTIRAIKEK